MWKNFPITATAKVKSCYDKCLKHFFGYLKYSSVTTMLCELGLLFCDNCKVRFYVSLGTCENILVQCVKNVS